MNILKKYLRLHTIMFFNLYRRILVKTDKKVFEYLFNFKSVLRGSPAKVSWRENYFQVSDKTVPGFKYQIRHQRQCNMAYEFGVKHRADGLADTYFLNFIDFEDGDVFLDCGANVGDLKIWFNLNNKNIEYIGFEPSPIEFNCLKVNVSPSVSHNVGLWNCNKNLTFFISSQGADSSLIEPASFEQKILINACKLDEFIAKPIKCLKLEAEGAEPEILEGLGKKLELIQYISADLGYERGVACESTIAPVTNFLLSRGFEMLHLDQSRLTVLFKNKRKSS